MYLILFFFLFRFHLSPKNIDYMYSPVSSSCLKFVSVKQLSPLNPLSAYTPRVKQVTQRAQLKRTRGV